MVGPQPLNKSGTKGNAESPLGSTRYATPRRGQWLGWLVRVEARRVLLQCIPPNGLVEGNGSRREVQMHTLEEDMCVQGMQVRGLCAGDEGQGAVCRG